jgi:hypothetical protein
MTVVAGFSVTVGTGSTSVITADATRKRLYLCNDSGSQIVYVSLGTAATVGSGVRLAAGGDKWDTPYTGAVYAIATAAGANVIGSTA